MCVCTLYISLTADITPEQQEFKDLAAKFSREEIIPVAAHYDQTGEVCTYLYMHLESALNGTNPSSEISVCVHVH